MYQKRITAMPTRFVTAVSPLAAMFAAVLSAQQPCASLAGLKLAHGEIISAALVAEGPFSANGGPGDLRPVNVPARCVVSAVARPTSDSEIMFQVWLPASGWNGKYEQVGNGGWAGTIPTSAMIEPLGRGYATAGTDDGHVGGSGANWAIGHPEKLIDFGYRAVHETNLQAQALIRAFYGKDASLSYFMGCSDGGREALMEAQRYPEDFVGIIAGAPANFWSHLFTGFIWNEQALMKDPASRIPPAKLPAIQKAVLAQCDGLDGVKDGLIEDPRACRFNPRELLCKGGDSDDCLTAAQTEALAKIYAGPKNTRTGAQIFPGYPPGTESVPGAWAAWIIPPSPQGGALQSFFGNSYCGQAVFEKPEWDFRTLNFDSDVALGDEKAGPVLNATSPDLRSFRAHGGKLIQYHGWGDPAISPISSIEYYESVRSFLGKYPDARSGSSKPAEDFYRLFMVPGMGHCGGGIGPNSFGNGGAAVTNDPEHDVLSALERWVEKGAAPDRLIGSGTVVGDPSKKLTRPLCAYPAMTRYNGTGDPNDAASFACAAPRN
jgi:feruloyl esterase